jgi:hypothetical protein
MLPSLFHHVARDSALFLQLHRHSPGHGNRNKRYEISCLPIPQFCLLCLFSLAALAAELVRTRNAISRIPPNARCHELFNRLDRLNTAPGSDRHAIQCSRGAREIKLPLEGPILK